MSSNMRNAALAKIHLGKKQLGLDDETYRQILKNLAGVDSSKDLNSHGLVTVIQHMRKCGARFEEQPGRHGRKPNNIDSAAHKAGLTKKIGALLADMKLSWEYASAIAKQMYKKDALEFCSSAELTGIIVALIKKQGKEKKT